VHNLVVTLTTGTGIFTPHAYRVDTW
jgi:hypothetical protein